MLAGQANHLAFADTTVDRHPADVHAAAQSAPRIVRAIPHDRVPSGLLALAVDERFHLKCEVIPDADEDAVGVLRQHVGNFDGTPADIGRRGQRQACRT